MEEKLNHLINKAHKGELDREDLILISEIARQTLKYMVEKNIPVVPENYTLFFLTFGELLHKGIKNPTDEQISNLCRQYASKLNAKINFEQFQKLQKKTKEILDESTKNLLFCVNNLERYDQKLANIQESAQEDNLKDLMLILTDEIRKLREENRKLSDALKSSTEKLISLQEKLSLHIEEASLDFLTQTLTRSALERIINLKLETLRQLGKPFCLIMIDPDNFKEINDRYGHLAGDQVLRTLGFLLKESVRDEDAVARYGGDEFAIVVSLPLKDVVKIAERIKNNIDKLKILWEDKEIKLGVSMGIAEARKDDNILSLISRADKALYLAKKMGKNRIATELDLEGCQ